MDAPGDFRELLLYTAGAVASIPLSGAVLVGMGAGYAAARSLGEMAFFNPEELAFRELYRKNFHKFFE